MRIEIVMCVHVYNSSSSNNTSSRSSFAIATVLACTSAATASGRSGLGDGVGTSLAILVGGVGLMAISWCAAIRALVVANAVRPTVLLGGCRCRWGNGCCGGLDGSSECLEFFAKEL